MPTDVDVLVAGAGGAGLTAALRAAEHGASVGVVEWREQFRQGNNTSMSTCMIPAGGSRWQAATGVSDDPDTFLADVMRKTHGTADPTIARALVDAAPALVAWLADHVGLELDLVTDFVYPGHSVARCHSVPDRSGRTLLAGLLAAVDRAEGVELMVPARLTDIALDDEGVTATVVPPEGPAETIRAGALVLATGGFGADSALVRELIPEIAAGLYFGGDGCHGDALRIGRSLGLDVGHLDAYQGHGSVAVPQNVLCTWATVMHGGIIVNQRGERFGDETVGYSEYGRRVLDQPGHEAWLILDERIDAACRPFRDYQDLLAQGGVRWAEDAPELAAATGLPEAALTTTLAGAAAAAGGAADPFGRTAFAGTLEPPYGWVRITGALFHTQGGLLVDGDARVLRGGRPVPRLYAAGGAAAGMSGDGADGYMAGNGLLAALGLGFLAGTHASA